MRIHSIKSDAVEICPTKFQWTCTWGPRFKMHRSHVEKSKRYVQIFVVFIFFNQRLRCRYTLNFKVINLAIQAHLGTNYINILYTTVNVLWYRDRSGRNVGTTIIFEDSVFNNIVISVKFTLFPGQWSPSLDFIVASIIFLLSVPSTESPFIHVVGTLMKCENRIQLNLLSRYT